MTVKVSQLSSGEDLSAATELLQRFFVEEGFSTPADMITQNTRILAGLPNCALLIAEDDGVAIGVATLSLEFGIEFGWSAEMGDLYVLPEWRGKGVSRMLVDAAEAFLRARCAAGYQVTVTPFAEEHHALGQYYEKLGFESEGRLILYKWLSSRGA
jgi:aminoglycoside 6'-N-acetyltransferase I